MISKKIVLCRKLTMAKARYLTTQLIKGFRDITTENVGNFRNSLNSPSYIQILSLWITTVSKKFISKRRWEKITSTLKSLRLTEENGSDSDYQRVCRRRRNIIMLDTLSNKIASTSKRERLPGFRITRLPSELSQRSLKCRAYRPVNKLQWYDSSITFLYHSWLPVMNLRLLRMYSRSGFNCEFRYFSFEQLSIVME